ncbi:MAG TPA: hypothetical protein VF625_16065, partial [Longimicrobium sp.]
DVPPGWCRGRGNPHNTWENCSRVRDGVYRDREGRYRDRNGTQIYRGSDGVYRTRNTSGTYDRNRNTSSSGSYDARHIEFHRYHDVQCRDRAAQARNVTDRIRVAGICKSEHDAWHRQQGVSHR